MARRFSPTVIRPNRPALPAAADGRRPPAKAGECVLLIDDDTATMFTLAAYLRLCGFSVDCAESAQSAGIQLRLRRPDLILLDVQMPETDGFEMNRRLKAHPDDREIPVLFVTGLGAAEEKVKAFEAGAVDYLTKPVHFAEVRARIRFHLDRCLAQAELIQKRDELVREMLRRTKTWEALERSLDRALIVANLAGEIQFCSAPSASLLRTHVPDMAPNQLPPGLLDGGAVGDLSFKLIPTPEGKEYVVLALHLARPPASFRDLLSLGLTVRETEILYWIAQGKTSPEAAVILSIAANTVKKHVQNMLPKLGVETRLAAALAATAILNRVRGDNFGASPELDLVS